MGNKEKWSKGKHAGTVVSDTRAKLAVPDGRSHNDVDYYGGYLVAESIPKEEYVNLINAAPDLLEALTELHKHLDFETHCVRGEISMDDPTGINAAFDMALAAITKARGEQSQQPEKGGEQHV